MPYIRNKKVKKTKDYSRHWVWTFNNPPRGSISYDENTMDYLVAGKEIGPKGTPHLQGYTCFKLRQRLSAVKKVLPKAHWEVKEGTPKQASDYCKKDGKWKEFGILPMTAKQATKQRWDDALVHALKGDFLEIPTNMLIPYYHNWNAVKKDNPDKPDDLTELDNYWIVAPTRYGKSRYARTRWPQPYDKAPNKWWVGYLGQRNVLCDDFSPKQCEFLHWYMKRWADLYSFPMETKGGGRQIRPARIIVTSQYHIEECFDDPRVIEAIRERFKVLELEHWSTRLTVNKAEYLRAYELLSTDEVLEAELDITMLPEPHVKSTQSTELYDSAEHSAHSLEERYQSGPEVIDIEDVEAFTNPETIDLT